MRTSWDDREVCAVGAAKSLEAAFQVGLLAFHVGLQHLGESREKDDPIFCQALTSRPRRSGPPARCAG